MNVLPVRFEDSRILFDCLANLPDANSWWVDCKREEEITDVEKWGVLSYRKIEVVDVATQKPSTVYVASKTFDQLGISQSVWGSLEKTKPADIPSFIQKTHQVAQQLRASLPFLAFIQESEIPKVTRSICLTLFLDPLPRHLSPKINGVPAAIYISQTHQIFIHFKKSQFDKGSFSKIKKAFYLNENKIVARRVSLDGIDQKVKAALLDFCNRPGIIHTYAIEEHKGKLVAYQELYTCNLDACIRKDLIPLTLEDQLELTSQWLEGLAFISDKGIHADIKPGNLVLRRNANGMIQGAIIDLDNFALRGQLPRYVTTYRYASPDYMLGAIWPTLDTWGMGRSLHLLFSRSYVNPLDKMEDPNEISTYLNTLKPNWVLNCFPLPIPSFVSNLINDMLHPAAQQRPTPVEAFARFTKEWEAWKATPTPPPVEKKQKSS